MENIVASRFLIDKYFSLEWCKENVLAPVSIEKITFSEEPFLLIIVGNLSYFATLDSLVRERIAKFNLKCIFLEDNSDKIYDIIDRASRINPQDFDLNNEKFDYKCLNNNYQDKNEFDSEMLEEKSKYRAKKRDLEELKDLFEENLINEEDYEKAKGKILNL